MLTPRGRVLGDAAIAVLAESGSRALTHRAVDARAGLGSGSTSNVARSRAALLELTVDRLAELDRVTFGEVAAHAADGVAGLADVLAAAVHTVLTGHRDRTLARFELTLEATRRPALRARFDAVGEPLRASAREVLVVAGSRDPDRHTRQVLAFMEGLLFTTSIDAQPVPDPVALRAMFADLLSGMLR